jgi:hypothetical protein
LASVAAQVTLLKTKPKSYLVSTRSARIMLWIGFFFFMVIFLKKYNKFDNRVKKKKVTKTIKKIYNLTIPIHYWENEFMCTVINVQ